jgi:hypothetical protein
VVSEEFQHILKEMFTLGGNYFVTSHSIYIKKSIHWGGWRCDSSGVTQDQVQTPVPQ